MIDKLVFEDVIGSVHYSSSDDIFFGKLEGVNDLVTFEGSSVKELKKSFIEAVKDYKKLCEQTGKNISKSFKGSFNVRIDPKLHELAYIEATKEGISLNQLVQVALKKQLVK
ncbi:MAG: type II toxin-antitoxin system HicB family antitoxin [Saprospiraceae bacterium]|nr:type II toxin-antitoxin system HicB family antitoxin [Saprospiraceae bacterium]